VALLRQERVQFQARELCVTAFRAKRRAAYLTTTRYIASGIYKIYAPLVAVSQAAQHALRAFWAQIYAARILKFQMRRAKF